MSALLLACPRCSTTDAVRAAVFGDGFWTTLGLLVLPVLIIAVLAVLLHRIGATADTEVGE